MAERKMQLCNADHIPIFRFSRVNYEKGNDCHVSGFYCEMENKKRKDAPGRTCTCVCVCVRTRRVRVRVRVCAPNILGNTMVHDDPPMQGASISLPK